MPRAIAADARRELDRAEHAERNRGEMGSTTGSGIAKKRDDETDADDQGDFSVRVGRSFCLGQNAFPTLY